MLYENIVQETLIDKSDKAEVRQIEELLERIPKPLLNWYDAHARILPWREMATPYRVWISEIMLQQTRVEAVKPYFERFINVLPTIQDLAVIEENSLLKLWEGLGYYNRARNLQKTAKIVVEQFQGELPDTYEELMKLPGIGTYTAGAISSIAYGNPVPAVDGNVLRVISRVTASEEDILKQTVKSKMEQDLKAVMPKDRAGAFNQALMEIGAMVCVPNGMAKCEECPLNHICKAKELDIVMELPKKSAKKPRTKEEKTILVIRSGDKVAIRKQNAKGLLAGLYEFPNLEGYLLEDEVLSLIKQMSLSPIRIQKLEPSKHIFTHKEWHMIGYVIKVDELDDDQALNNGIIFVDPQETEKEYPIPMAFQTYTKYMNISLGNEKFQEKR